MKISTGTQSGAMEVEEFMTWARIGRTKTYEEINAGRLKAIKIGRKTLIRRADATAWLNSLENYMPQVMAR